MDAAERGIIDYTLTAQGKAAHSSRPDLGANAIHGLFAFANAALTATAPLQAKDDPILGTLPTTSILSMAGIRLIHYRSLLIYAATSEQP